MPRTQLTCVCLSPFHIIIILFFVSPNYHSFSASEKNVKNSEYSLVEIGVVLDRDSPTGIMADLCINMALSDFYSENGNYRTRLNLTIKDADSLLDTNLEVINLLKHDKVHGILGHQSQLEDKFIAEIAGKFHVPIISLTSRGPALPDAQNRYFIRTTPDDSYQAQALAAICKGYKWDKVLFLYEDTDYGYQFLSHLNKAFQEVEIQIAKVSAISMSLEDIQILKELNKLIGKQAKVFLVHMNPSLGYRLFMLAKKVGMMTGEHSWIITDYLSNSLTFLDLAARDSMKGVLGLRPYVPRSEKLDTFQEKWKMNMVMKNQVSVIRELNVYGLWIYDTMWSLAIAAEKIVPVDSSLLYVNTSDNGIYNNLSLKISAFGPKLLSELSRVKSRGLSGDFELTNGHLKPAFEIFNLFGSGEKTVGFWISGRGVSRELSSNGEPTYSTSAKNLKKARWPGDSLVQKLRVGVPVKRGFEEFVRVTVDHKTNQTNVSGFSIDIFRATLKCLPFRIVPEFHYYNVSNNITPSYDGMLHKIPKDFDMVVGDTTLWAPRANYIDFSLPYSESGVILVVKNKKLFDMWIFIKPLRWDLWLAILLACIVIGIVLRILEKKMRNTNEESIGRHRESLQMLYLSPIAILAFPERNMVANSWSIFVLVFWLFMAFILMQSYTANLSAILTVDQLKFSFSEGCYVGYQDGSFMIDFLTMQLHIPKSRLKGYSSVEQYHNAMSKGSKNGGIDVIFDEIPYMKILLKKYDSQYKMVGPTYRTDGFGFAFPVGSNLTRHFSRAILNVTQGSDMMHIEQRNLGPGYSSQDPLSSTISQETASLTFYDFGGLFIIVGSATLFALLCSETSVVRKFIALTAHYSQICFSSISSKFHSTQHDKYPPNHESIQNSNGTTISSEVLSGGEEKIFQPSENNNVSTSVEDQEVELVTVNEGGNS